ncbi:hypothetical protein [Treponema phagedenis]|nr:hypothetical protein [Treponema phagedenis]EFW37601.1 hypothetical protein HMPREF9554_01897 [Treponema phagedenis F0421]NVP23073.1 hypothetical protein [Treponema phagedenis]QKS92301.1 hypothetical protein HPJ96_06910 [Treponema phagedenis]QLC57944.1 hypothetical protein HW453_03335 [Treponema phagedenis]
MSGRSGILELPSVYAKAIFEVTRSIAPQKQKGSQDTSGARDPKRSVGEL